MEDMQDSNLFIPRKKFNYLTGWEERKDDKPKKNCPKIAKTVKINGKTIGTY